MTVSAPNLGRSVVRGTFWTYASYYSGKILVFISTLILARLLSEDDFGVAGYAVVVIGFLDVLTDLGIGPAIIYHHEKTHSRDTAFWLGMVVSFALFAITYVGAPLVGAFFFDERAVPVTRALAFTYPLSALGNIHDMLLRKELSFGKKFIPDVVKSFSKGLISIVLALLNFGPWSLIIGQLIGTAISSAALWLVYPWRPSLRVDNTMVRPFLSYGLRMVSVDAAGMILSNSDYLLVGRYLGSAALGVYSLAFRVPELLILQFCNIISKVIFPVYSRIRDDSTALGRGFIITMQYVSLVTIPMGLGIALVAEPFVQLVFSSKWVEAIPVVRAISIYAMVLSLSWNSGDIYKAEGRPGLLTQISMSRAVVLVPALLWAVLVPGTVEAVAWVQTASAFLAGFFQLVIASRMLHTPFSSILGAIAPAAIGGLGMTAAVVPVLALTAQSPDWVQLFLGMAVGGVVYFVFIWMLKRDLILGGIRMIQAAARKKSPVSA